MCQLLPYPNQTVPAQGWGTSQGYDVLSSNAPVTVFQFVTNINTTNFSYVESEVHFLCYARFGLMVLLWSIHKWSWIYKPNRNKFKFSVFFSVTVSLIDLWSIYGMCARCQGVLGARRPIFIRHMAPLEICTVYSNLVSGLSFDEVL